MKKLFSAVTILFVFLSAFGQDEELTPLKYNATVYRATKKQEPTHSHRYLIDKGIYVVTSDTLHLPFIDDFTSNKLGTVGWNQNHVTDTFYNVFGTCLAIEGVPLIEDEFMNDTSWSYTYNTVTHQIDSTANPVDTFTFFGPATSACFTQTPSTFHYWSKYYTYTFDSTGARIDSALVKPTDTIFYAPVIYFAQGEPGKLWSDDYAYVNNTYPVNPPNIGVATLDGLNEYGLPYNNSSNNTYGTADYLTSKPINLSGLNEGDSVYLSFFFEPQGLGDYPDLYDSLVLEFKDLSGAWHMVWNDTGFVSATAVPQQFNFAIVWVPSLPFPNTYYHSTFQFRFRNQASLYGNNDHWHIDYVRLDKNRFYNDAAIHERGFVYPFPTILKNYTLMPADQFNYPSDLRDSIILMVHNIDSNANNNPPATNFVKGATEIYPSSVVIAPDFLQTFNAAEYSYIQVNPSAEYTQLDTSAWPVDSLVISSRVFLQSNDIRPQDDTLYHTQKFDYTMAYDDGSAELSYGLSGVGIKKFAYEFVLNHPDTLTAFQVQFSQVEGNVSDLVFNFYAWDSLKMNDFIWNDTISQILSLENKKPLYVDSVNGFTTYKLDTPLYVSGKVYLGWSQTDTRKLQVGYDMNSKLGKPHMYVFSNFTWKPSSIVPEGSPMIRLILDDNFWGWSTAVADLTNDGNNVNIYPNPTTGSLNIRSEKDNAIYEATVVNLLGETVKYQKEISNHLNIEELQTGVYLLSLRDIQTGKRFHHKIIKTGM